MFEDEPEEKSLEKEAPGRERLVEGLGMSKFQLLLFLFRRGLANMLNFFTLKFVAEPELKQDFVAYSTRKHREKIVDDINFDMNFKFTNLVKSYENDHRGFG